MLTRNLRPKGKEMLNKRLNGQSVLSSVDKDTEQDKDTFRTNCNALVLGLKTSGKLGLY